MRAREFTNTRRMAKIEDTGKIVQILQHADRVGFSDERGWFLINTNPDTKSHMGVKWIPDTTRFTWVRDFDSLKENQTATSRQVLNYINRTHHEPFRPGEKMYQAVAAHPHWELRRVPLLNLNIPDQEYDDVDYDDQEPESDPYGRVMVVEPEHAGRVSQHLIDKNPIVIDADRYIIDGNHRAWAAKYLLNRDYIMAWVPVKKPGMAEAFDRPYRGKWERSEYGQDMLVKLPDGSNLSIMFNLDHGAYGDEEWTVEFWRGNSQDVTGAGDQQRVFATVLSAIKKFIDREHPERIRFSANKAVDPGQKSMSRSNLYDRLVQRYANSWGYDVDIDDFADTTVYNLHSLNESVTEGQYRIPRAIEDFLDGLTADDVGVEEIGPYRIHFEGFTDDCKSSKDYRRNPEAVYQQVFNDFIQREGGRQPIIQDMVGDEDYPILYSIFRKPKTKAAVKEVNYPDELTVSDKIQQYFFKRGYDLAGEGRDQMAFESPRGTIVKVLGTGDPERESVVRNYVAFFERNQRNPFYPRIYNSGEFTIDGETYFVYEMERVNYVANEEQTLDYIEKLMSAVDREQGEQFLQKNPVPAEMTEDEIFGLIQATEDMIQVLGGVAPLDLTAVENLGRRNNGHLVIVDPYSL